MGRHFVQNLVILERANQTPPRTGAIQVLVFVIYYSQKMDTKRLALSIE